MAAEGSVHDLAVIGAGPAGCGAAVQCRRMGFSVALLDRTGRPGGLVREARLLENYPGLPAPVSGPDFCACLETMLAGHDIEVLEFDVRSVSLRDGLFRSSGSRSGIASRALVLAVGTEPVDYRLKAGDGVVLHRSLPELKDLGPSDAVIIGGGEAALDYALNLSDSGTRVRILVRGPGTRAGGRLLEEVVSRRSIEVLFDTLPVEAVADAQGGCRLTVLSGGVRSVIRTDAILAAVGRRPVLPALDFRPDLVPGTVQTPVNGLFAAGDACMGSLGQASSAAGQGVTAGMLACAFLKEREQPCSM
ncbi:MAG: hypothetical protein AVO35_09180 [Candidatus Aegiribacteria sp. MLS_C]|nr:MAG: hypothetical protein AVO35_09180 [Candidatus Aegiribacteria sp. MLS_C]